MNRRLAAYLTLCTIALTPCGARAELVQDDTYFKNENAYHEIRNEVEEERNRVLAKCQLDVDQYIDEHPQLLTSRMVEVIPERLSLCMQASGYPRIPNQGEPLSSFCIQIWDTNARVRKRWAAAGRDAQWFDQYVSESAYSGRDLGCAH